MKTTKYISLALASAMVLAHTSTTSAQVLRPSLNEQMSRQEIVNQEYSESQIAMQNAHALEMIRQRNQARMENISQISAVSPTIESIVSEMKPTAEIKTTTTTRNIGNIDMARVEAAWLGWVNDLRAENGLAPYQANPKLSATAQEWAEFSRDRGYTTHGRPGDGCVGEKNYVCYNYKVIDQWFKDRGVFATNINRSTHTENVGYGSFKCTDGECTDEAIKAIRKTFDFFHREKSYNGVHYRTMVNKNFTEMGLGVAVKNGTYYLAAHYSTPLK